MAQVIMVNIRFIFQGLMDNGTAAKLLCFLLFVDQTKARFD